MKKTLFIIFASFLLVLNATAEPTPKAQNIAAGQEASQTENSSKALAPKTAHKEDVRQNSAAQNHENNCAKCNNEGHVVSLLGLKISDWIALGLGTLAIIVSICGLRQNRISNEKQNRAYVYVANCIFGKTKNDKPIIIVKMINGGATPATKMTKRVWVGIEDSLEYDKPIPNSVELQPHNTTAVYLAPNDFKYYTLSDDRLDNEIDAIKKGKKCVKLYVISTYQDAFGKTQTISFKFKYLASKSDGIKEMVIADEGLIST